VVETTFDERVLRTCKQLTARVITVTITCTTRVLSKV
jgi:hypothetical protein